MPIQYHATSDEDVWIGVQELRNQTSRIAYDATGTDYSFTSTGIYIRDTNNGTLTSAVGDFSLYAIVI
jgi:hypothetical protein